MKEQPNAGTGEILRDLYWEARNLFDTDPDNEDLSKILIGACNELHRLGLMSEGQRDSELLDIKGPELKTAWFTFGQDHSHKLVTGETLHRDWVVKITAEDPRAVMFEMFGNKWSMQYDEQPDMLMYPCGEYVIEELPD